MGSERREDERIDTNIEIQFKEKGSFTRSYMLNVSNGGLFIKTTQPLPLEAKVNLLVTLPETSEAMNIIGRVVWINPKAGDNIFPPGMGIQFLDLSKEHKDIIKAFVDKHKAEIKERSII